MTSFQLYFNLGLEHILDIDGMDHIIFVVILCAVYLLKDWKKVLILVTAFTIGHSVTLALATLNIIRVNTELVEFLIPVTILVTAIFNILKRDRRNRKSNVQFNYYLALFFGFIHGMGFSNVLRSLLGNDESIITQLLAFNIGLEVGQIIIVTLFLIGSFIFVDIFNVSRRDWRIVISSAGGGIALLLIIESSIW